MICEYHILRGDKMTLSHFGYFITGGAMFLVTNFFTKLCIGGIGPF